jgi:hypothetical protein
VTGLDVTVGELRVLCHHEACQHARPVAEAMLLAPGDLLLCSTDGAHRVRREDRAALAAAVAPAGALELLLARMSPGHCEGCPQLDRATPVADRAACSCGWAGVVELARAAGVGVRWL